MKHEDHEGHEDNDVGICIKQKKLEWNGFRGWNFTQPTSGRRHCTTTGVMTGAFQDFDRECGRVDDLFACDIHVNISNHKHT